MAWQSFKACLLLTNMVLFYSEGKKKMADADDNPMGKDKGAIYGAIAQLIFANHIKYGAAYCQNQKKFCNSVSNQISGLRTKYKKHKGSTPPCPPLHLPGLYNSPDVDVDIRDDFGAADDDDLYLEGMGPFSTPLRNTLEHLDGDEMMDHDGDALSHSVWHSEAVQPWGATQSVVGDVPQHLNTLINNSQHYSLIGLPYVAYPADLPAEQHRGLKEKKAKSDVLQEVVHVRDKIESMHSDAMSCHDSRHQRFLAKLGAKSEHNWDSKKYEWLRGTREHEASQATVSHQCLQEQQDAEICLRETDIRVHEAHSLVLNKEAETLRLKIQFHQMTQGNRTPASDGAT
ncbi:hypothetical protein BDR05DRAFT_947609 [Suillus weaverae]|nr:hypothetical protein BDR05DRAFT_947609 [Suillus weaverae]